MSLIINKYENNIDKCWYDSSTIIYSECVDNKDSYKDLKVTFKDGRTYLYKGLIVQDYLLFRSDISQGKALNKYIAFKNKVTGKNKYEFEKSDSIDVNQLNEEKVLLIEERDKTLKELLNVNKNE